MELSPRLDTRRSSTFGASARSNTKVTTEAVELQMQQLMDDWHFRMVQSTMGRTWSQEEATKAVLELFQLNGLCISEAEMTEMTSYVDDSYLVSDLVDKMSVVQREELEDTGSYFLELLDTTSAIRRVLDDNVDAERIQEVIEETDSCPMGQAILKQAVIEASKEVAQIYHNQDTWVKSMSKRLDRLQRSAEFAEHAQQQLMAVETQLDQFAEEQSKKSRGALANLAHENDKSLMHSVFSSWNGICKNGAGERAIRRKYELLAQKAEKDLFEYKERRIANVRKVLMRNARDTEEGGQRQVLQVWHAFVDDRKRTGSTKEKMMELEGQLHSLSKRATANTHKVLARLGAESEEKWLGIAFGAWVKFHHDYAADREMEDAVKKAEQQFKGIMDKQKGDTQKIIQNMHGSSQNGLLSMVIQAWYHYVREEETTRKMEAQMNAKGANFKSLNSKTKNNAMSAQGRVNEQVKLNIQCHVFCVWLTEFKVNNVERFYDRKLNHKRQQLSSVQNLFKSFAKQLEEGLSNLDGESSGRTKTSKMKGGMVKDPGMIKGDQGSVSLPNIHAKQGVVA